MTQENQTEVPATVQQLREVYVTHLQLSEALENQSDKLTSKFTDGFDRVISKLDSVQLHTDGKIDSEVTSIYKRIDRESSQNLQIVEKIREDRKIGLPIIIAVISIFVAVIGGLGRWMQVTASDVEVQKAVSKIHQEYQEEYRNKIRDDISKEDYRNELQESAIQENATRISQSEKAIANEISERRTLENRVEKMRSNHIGSSQ